MRQKRLQFGSFPVFSRVSINTFHARLELVYRKGLQRVIGEKKKTSVLKIKQIYSHMRWFLQIRRDGNSECKSVVTQKTHYSHKLITQLLPGDKNMSRTQTYKNNHYNSWKKFLNAQFSLFSCSLTASGLRLSLF